MHRHNCLVLKKRRSQNSSPNGKKKHESRKIKEKKGKPTEESHVQLLPVVIDVGENVERS